MRHEFQEDVRKRLCIASNSLVPLGKRDLTLMPLAEFLAELDQLCRDAQAAFDAAGDAAALEAARIDFLGMKSGRIKSAQKGLGSIDKADKPKAGQRFNEVKQHLDAAFEAAQARLASGAATIAAGPQFDPTVPGVRPRLGHLHPLTQTIEELKDLMGRLGVQRGRWPRGRRRVAQLRGAEYPRGTSGAEPAGQFLSGHGGQSSEQGAGSREQLDLTPRSLLPAPCSFAARRARCRFA